MDASWLMLSGLFSLIGFAVFTYGRKQRTATHTLVGVVLMAYPYFVQSAAVMIGVGVLLLVGMVVGNRIENG
jgi:hypothetical protein